MTRGSVNAARTALVWVFVNGFLAGPGMSKESTGKIESLIGEGTWCPNKRACRWGLTARVSNANMWRAVCSLSIPTVIISGRTSQASPLGVRAGSKRAPTVDPLVQTTEPRYDPEFVRSSTEEVRTTLLPTSRSSRESELYSKYPASESPTPVRQRTVSRLVWSCWAEASSSATSATSFVKCRTWSRTLGKTTGMTGGGALTTRRVTRARAETVVSVRRQGRSQGAIIRLPSTLA